MASSSDESRAKISFTEGVSSSAEGELAIDEDVPTVTLAPNPCVVPDLIEAVTEGEECIRHFLEHLSGNENALSHPIFGGEADDDDSFHDIMGDIIADGVAESEGRTFSDALARANLSVETLKDGVIDTSQLPTC